MEAEVELHPITVDHSNHDPEWVVGNKKCVACIVTTCADASEANVKKRHFLAELVDIIRQNQCNVVSKLQIRVLAANHLIDVLFGLICTSDLVLADIASEGLITIFLSVKYENGVELTMRKITKSLLNLSNIQECLPVVKLTGNLFKKLPYTVNIFMRVDGGSVLNVLSQSLSYPNENVKSSILFLFVQLCKEIEWQTMNSHIKSQLIREVLKILKREQSRKLLINALAMLRFLIQDEQSLDELFEITVEDATFPLALKKVLLCRECQLQIATVQCLKLALDQNNFKLSKANLIMENDVLEILFEILTTDNQILIDSVFCCLLQFTQYENFFLKCHSVFGIEPIVRCIHQLFTINLIPSLATPLRLLQEIFIRQPHGVTLFSTSFSMQLTISVLLLGINSSHRNISLEATRAVQCFLRKDFLYLPIPLDDIKNVILSSSKNTSELFTHQWRIAAKRKKSTFTHVQITQEEKLLIAKLSLLHGAIKLIKECGLDPVSFEDTFKPPKHNCNHLVVMEELTRTFLKLLDDVFMPTFLQNINLFYTCDVHVNIIRCLSEVNVLSPEITRQFFVFLSQIGFLEKLWDINVDLTSINDSKELKTASHELLRTMLVSLKHNNENMDDISLNIYNFNYCSGTLKDCVLILSDYPHQPDIMQSQASILEILYFHKLYSDCNVVDSIDLLEILSSFIHNVARIDLLPKDAFKCLMFLFAVSFMESEQNFQRVESSIQIISTCLQTHFLNSLTHLYSHHSAFMFWVFSFPDLANIFGYTAVSEWLAHYYSANSKDDLKMFSILLSENEMCMDLFLRLVTEEAQKIHRSIWSMLDELFSNLECDLQVKTQSVLMDKFCNLALQRTEQSSIEDNDKSLEIILKIICKVVYKDNSDFTMDLKVVQTVCNTLFQSQNNEILFWCCHYLNLIVNQSSQRKDSRALGIILSKLHVLEKIETLCKKNENCVRYSALNLISTMVRFQFKFKIQTSFSMKFELDEFQVLLKTHQQTEILQSAICLLSALLKTSFKSTFFILLNIIRGANSNLNANAFRTIYILLQNIALQNDEMLKEVVFKCIGNLLTFVQAHDEKLGVHLIRQAWIGILLESQLKYFLNTNNSELRSLFYMFLENKVNNNHIGKFIAKLINYLSTEFNSLQLEEKNLGMELITKISTSIYQDAVKPVLRQELEQMLNIPEE